jgi:hypothetical protein
MADPTISIRLTLDVSTGFLCFLERLAADTGEDPADVMRLALGLLRTAVDARREGNRIAILDDSDNTEQEIEF